jgi:O-antigen/teichoic acid export membrane protein
MNNKRDSEFLRYLVAPSLALISAPLLANGLGASGRGVYSSIVNLVLFMAIAFGVGLDLLLASEQNVKHELSIVPSILKKYSYYLQIIPLLSSFIVINLFYGEYLNVLEIFFISLTLPILIVFNLTASYARHSRNLRMLGVIQSHAAVVRTIFIFSLFALGVLNLASVVILTFFANIFPLINIFKGKQFLRVFKGSRQSEYCGPRMNQGFKVLPASLLTIATYRLDQILGIFIIGESQLGIYAVAVSICEIPILLVRSYKDGLYRLEEHKVKQIIKKAMSRILILLLMIAFALPFFFNFVLSPEYKEGLIVAEAMLVVIFVQALFELNSMHLIRRNKFNQIIMLQMTYLFITFGIAILVKSFGAMSFVFGNLLGYTFALLFLLKLKGSSDSNEK